MDETICARFLWATTGRMTVSQGNQSVLVDARAALAAILSQGHADGFAPPLVPSAEERQSKAWRECVDAALAAPPQGAVPTFALLWAGNPSSTPPTAPADDHGLAWPTAAGTTFSRAIGPLKDESGQEVWLFLYSAIDAKEALAKDGDAEPGFFPRAGRHRAAADVGSAADDPGTPRRSAAWAWILFVASIVLGAYAIVWVYAASEFARGAASDLLAGTRWVNVGTDKAPKYAIEKTEAEGAVTQELEPCLYAIQLRIQNPLGSTDQHVCDTDWNQAWSDQGSKLSSRGDWWQGMLAWFWKSTDVRGALSLLWPLVTSALAIVLLVLAAGIATKSYFLGAFLDERNRISLSRMQQIAWTVILLGGYTILAIFNISLLAGFTRDLAQSAALTGAAASGAPSASIQGLFPSMDGALWAVLGLTVLISPYLSQRILAAKDVKTDGQDWNTVAARAVMPEKLDERTSAGHARVSDLFTGEGEADAGRVDVSRLQHLVITGLLLSSYIVLLVEYVRTVDGTSILFAALTGAPVFTAMPPIDATFVGLLALSHAGYLAFKALPGAVPGDKK